MIRLISFLAGLAMAIFVAAPACAARGAAENTASTAFFGGASQLSFARNRFATLPVPPAPGAGVRRAAVSGECAAGVAKSMAILANPQRSRLASPAVEECGSGLRAPMLLALGGGAVLAQATPGTTSGRTAEAPQPSAGPPPAAQGVTAGAAPQRSALDMLTMLALCGLMGMVGQGVRTVVGLKKLSDMYNTAPSETDRFNAARIVIGLMIGFLAGVIGAMTSDVFNTTTITREGLLYLAGVGYIGVDVIEAFAQKLGAGRQPPPVESTGAGGAAAGPEAEPAVESGAGVSVIVRPEPTPKPVTPAHRTLVREILPTLSTPHTHFSGGVSWALTADGVAIDEAAAKGTPGEPTTVRKIWRNFGQFCAASAAKYGVPVELIVATIATESGGNPSARRMEPQINDQSVGLMQTLVSTARAATGRKGLRADDLLDPAVSIDAGAAYIADQRRVTHFDPPLVAAAYNAGSLRRDPAPANRWQLHCFPKHTGRHVDHYVAWFNDCMKAAAADGWGVEAGAPSFAAEMGGGPLVEHPPAPAPERPRIATSSPSFPPLPNFLPLVSTEDRQAAFGAFHYAHDPQPGNPEHIRVTDDWADRNIKAVTIPVQHAFGKAGPFEVQFHRLAEPQLVALWLEWERQGLLDRVLTWGGGYVPRLMRKSRSRLSNHAFGTAFDINASYNPMGAQPALVGQRGSVRELVPIANKYGFFWGGHFKGRPDGMHFEVAELLPEDRVRTLAGRA